MIRTLSTDSDPVAALLKERTVRADPKLTASVQATLQDVAAHGDETLLDHARRYDSPSLGSLRVDPASIAAAEVPPAQEEALQVAAGRIRAFHDEQFRRLHAAYAWQIGGVGQRMIPLQRVGVYVPGGKANYPSSVLMNALPARSAGVADVVMVSPARPDGTLSPAVLRAARLCGITEVYAIGGAAAIAGLALGTQTIAPVDKVVGPGNRFVNEAKRQLWGRVGLDGYAGPSEVCVVADETAPPAWAAGDLLTQIEHSEDNAGFLIATSPEVRQSILQAADLLLYGSPREALIRRALASECLAITVRDLDEAMTLVDLIAPEHLTLMIADPAHYLDRIHHAGCILLGPTTPQSAADWVLGPSHTLPTARAARFGSPVNVLDFLKVQSISNLSPDLLQDLIPIIDAFGEMEGFPMHARAARLRAPEP